MKVDSSPDSYIGSVAGGPQKATAPAAAEAGAAASAASAAKPQAGVTVTLSSSTTEARAVSGGADVFNADKVAAMKDAIANGSFKVNAEAIADKMLANAAEMLGGPRT
ncbi:MAG: flagellar biosynthesis anti-sigma factor FlgM [Hydrogenophaga sp.]|jgi:negative regulator of flagellin synthesis FlgM|uniref:flagellar biosynthesis anti-sigma factor FlgM n=1 Tax=Hydrogenophaga sp. TaxID=1904254 RepID=UPI002AB904FD|nr:flagellar biosynthesis anti-sigma factor FlgM [Hydrogenophaga sp.]MDZ4102272.1 flagellar biosynthesis anti-sigma factor FlgM [Hydrogenophaga sp.]